MTNINPANKMALAAAKNTLAEKNNKVWLLRNKQFKSFAELAKNIRMHFLAKTYNIDVLEKANLQKTLDGMQQCIKVKTRQGLIERLESLSRQLGLKLSLMEDTGLFISSDMFFLEIILDKNTVQDVKVHHEGNIEQQSCNELVLCLQNGDFADFTLQLEGLQSIYQLNAEPKIKSKAFVALQALETDLYTLYDLAQLQAHMKDPQLLIMQSPVGMLQRRRGGHAMRCTFLVPPYDLIDPEKKQLQPLTAALINSKKLGRFVTVNLEAAAANKLQTCCILNINKDSQGRSSPTYAPLMANNSTMLPASFMLRMDKPMPISMKFVEQLNQLQTESSSFATTVAQTPTPLIDLIVTNCTDNEVQTMGKGLFVSLLDQCHYYYMTENKALQGIVVSKIPFTEPGHVPQIIKLLRQQALFNTLISSCIRTNGKQDIENMILFEINAISEQYISVSLENPHQESLETVEFDLSDCCNVVCKLFSNSKTQDAAIAEHLSRCLQKTFSIPVTLRALLKYWERENVKTHQPYEDGGKEPGGGGGSRLASGSNTKYIKSDPNGVTGGGGSSNVRMFHANGGGGGGANDGAGSSLSGDTNFLNQLPSDIQLSMAGSGASDSINQPIKRRRLTGEDFWKNPKSSKTDEFDIGSDSNSSLGGKSAADKSVGVQQQQSQYSGAGISEFEMFVEGKKKGEGGDATDDDVELDFETGEIFRQQQKKLPNVSITAINVAGLERRPGIEIIPITSTSQNLPSSITITPINVGGSSKSEKKTSGGGGSSSKKHDDRNRLEKKKKRKRDDSPAMGPPEKIPTKQELLANKPISLSINPLSTAAAGLIRKYSSSSPTALATSPKHQSSMSVSGGSSSSGSIKSSPKHSPVHSQASNSPKHGISSPKHPGSGGGKPSVTTLKSLNSPKSSEKSSSSSFPKDREKKSSSSSGGSSPKISKSSSSASSSSAKIKLLDDVSGQAALQLLSGGIDEKSMNLSGNLLTSASGSPSSAGAANSNNQNRNRKGLLSAVIDKLSKSAQNTTDESSQSSQSSSPTPSLTGNTVMNFKTSSGGGGAQQTVLTNNNNANPGGNNKNSEYMVKHSSDGMKITINKTIRAKESGGSKGLHKSSSFSASSSPSGSSSPKASHTGLKPGVSSGPASKKSQSGAPSSGTTKSTSASKLLFQKSSSSGSLGSTSVKQQSSGSGGKDPNKAKLSKSQFLPSNDMMKMLGFPASASQVMEGFMKSFDTKFQIPKLSARSNSEDGSSKKEKAPTPSSPSGGNGSTNDAKMMFSDFLAKDHSNPGQAAANKYQYSYNKTGEVSPMHFAPPSSSPKYSNANLMYNSAQLQENHPQHTPPRPPPIESPKFYNNKDESSSNSLDLLQQMRPPSMSPNSCSDMTDALNHINKTDCTFLKGNSTTPPMVKPSFSTSVPAASVSAFVIKSPVPSPLSMVIPSPHSNSSEMDGLEMDGIGGK